MRPVALALGLFLVTPVAADEPAPPTAWGRPVGKLQLGLRAKAGPLAGGATAELEVVVRNVGAEAATVRSPWAGWQVSGVARDGVLTGRDAHAGGGFGGLPHKTRLDPGAERVVGRWPLAGPAGPDPLLGPDLTRVRPGAYRAGVEYFRLGVGDADAEVELGTGYLDVAVPAAGPPAAGAVAWGRPVGRYQAGLRVKPGGPADGLAVSLQVVVRNVGSEPTGLRYESRQYVRGEEFVGTVTGRFRTPFGGGPGLLPFNRPGLAPGAAEVIADWEVARPPRPGAPAPLSPGVATELAPGTYRMGVERLQIGSLADDVIELGTGYLDVVVPAAK